jgi:hypothetical protein
MYAFIQDNTFVRWVNLREEYSRTSFPEKITQACLPAGLVIVEMNSPTTNPGPRQVIERNEEPVLEDGRWCLSYRLRDMTEAEITETAAARSFSIRNRRNTLLTESDWSQLADAPVDKAAWADYRQDLRNVTSQEGFPFNVQWPTMPT